MRTTAPQLLTFSLGLAAAAAAAATAAAAGGPLPGHAAQHDAVRARQTSAATAPYDGLLDLADRLGISGCLAQLAPLTTELPSPPPALLLDEDLLRQALAQTGLGPDRLCAFTVTGAPAAPFTSFLPAVLSWYDAHRPRIAGAVAECPAAAPLTRTLDAFRRCDFVSGVGGGGGGGGGGTAAAAPTSTSAPGGTATRQTSAGDGVPTPTTTTMTPVPTVATTSESRGAAAPVETGHAVAALMAAGFLGAVMAL